MLQSRDLDGGDSALDSLEEFDDLSDPDYEDRSKAKKRKKAPVQGLKSPERSRLKAHLKEGSSPTDSSSVDSPPRRPPRPLGGLLGISADDIYTAVLSGKGSLVTVVDEWLDIYKQSREAGFVELVNFIVQACGCKGVVSREMFDSLQNAEIISELTKEFPEDSANYPLSTPGPQFKRFKASLSEFAKVLVRSCQNSLVYDEYLFPSLLALLTGLSDSQVRAFRHTGTLLAIKLMTELVSVAARLLVQQQTIRRRYNIENNKTALQKAPESLEELQATLYQLHENREELSSLINATFRGVFVHRYRDKLPEIRSACIEELGLWLKINPEDFLKDGCLKYLGWNLHDKQSAVRLQCVRALQDLYQEKEFIGRLELFTSRFKERILSMVLDKEADVALEVVNLLLLIQQNTEEGLEEDECGLIYPLVYASHRGLACAAGTFLYRRMEVMFAEQKQGSLESDSAGLIQMIIAFYIQCGFHEHGAYLVDSLWDTAGSRLRDWETMTAYLLGETDMSDEEEGALLEVMICAIQRASQATAPVGRRTHGKKNLSQKDKKTQEQDRGRITAHFAPLLPSLLTKFSADAAKVALLLKAPLYFDLEMFCCTPSLSNHLDQLLSQICGLVEKHADAAVLEACSRLACSLCSDRYAFSSRAHTAFSQLMDTLTDCFNSYMTELLQGSDDEDDVYSVALALKRIGAMSCAINPISWKLFEGCLQLLSGRLETLQLEAELMVSALKCCAFHLMWAKVNAVTSATNEAEMKILKKQTRSFCRVCQTCLSVAQAQIRDQAFELLCDLLLLFSEASVRSEPALRPLVYLPSDGLRSDMAAFLLDYIFSDADDGHDGEGGEMVKLNQLQRKRNQLAGFCKLVIYGVFGLFTATDVFKHYSKFYKDFGDIIKETISRTKLINPVQSAKTIGLSLQQLFSEMLTEDSHGQALGEIRDLAKRLAMSFGIDLHRASKPLVALHMDCIGFAFRVSEGEEELQNVPFLEILSEFSFKLLPKGRAELASFLKAECPESALCWSSVKLYTRSLEAQSVPKPREQDEVEQSEAVPAHNSPARKRRKTTAKASVLDSSSIHLSLSSPALTSTAQKLSTKRPLSKVNSPLSKVNSPLSKVNSPLSGASSGSTEPFSEEEFSDTLPISQKRIVRTNKPRRKTQSTLEKIDSNLTLLSLFEEDEEEEQVIHNYESDLDTVDSQLSARPTPSVLDELFD